MPESVSHDGNPMSAGDAFRRTFRRLLPKTGSEELWAIEERLDRLERIFGEQAGGLMLQAQVSTNRSREEADAVRAHLERRIDETGDSIRTHAQRQSEELNEQTVEQLVTRLNRLERRIKRAGDRNAAAPAVAAPSADASAPPVAAEPFAAIDYEALEERFRGPSEAVRVLQAQYVDDIAALPVTTLPVLDIGCGRGEFVAMVGETDASAYGIDLDAAFVQNGVDAGLDIRLEDAIGHLRSLDADSLRAVCAFHVVEHLSTAVLVDLLEHADRVIAPGGALILETPNPENLSVGAHRFWLDPTHIKPVPPMLLQFLVEQSGFDEVEIRRLNRSEPVVEVPSGDQALASVARALNDALAGPADYAVIARCPLAS
jgi:SAM-dependent methyltransferase